MTDRELLLSYRQRGEAAVFAQLVERHAGSVYAACLRVLNDTHAAEDASQAVFLIFAQKARALPDGTILAGWLYQTALGVASNARRMAARRKRHEREAAAVKIQNVQEKDADMSWEQLRPNLDTALSKLPAPQRDAIVLCFLQGRARDEAAAELGCPVKTLNSRVSLALEKLRAEFAAAGVSTSAALLTQQLSAHALGSAPAGLTAACLQSANAGAAAMANGFLHAAFIAKLKAAALGLAALLALAVVAPRVYRALASAGAPGQTAGAAPGPAPTPMVAEPREDAPPPEANPSPQKTAFVPKGGRMLVQSKLPANFVDSNGRRNAGLVWSRDSKSILVLTGRKLENPNGEEQSGYPSFVLDAFELALATGKFSTIRASYVGEAGSTYAISNGRVLTQAKGGALTIHDTQNKLTRIGGIDAKAFSEPIDLTVSPSGDFASWYAVRQDGTRHSYCTFVAALDGSPAKLLEPPAPRPDDAKLKLSAFPHGWTADNTLTVDTSWNTGEQFSPDEDRRAWTYDAPSGKFAVERTDLLPLGYDFVEYAYREPELNDALWQLPEQRRLRRVLVKGAAAPAAQPAPPANVDPKDAPRAPRMPSTRKAGSAEALEVLDASGKVLKRITLDTKVLDGGDVWPRLASTDGRYVLLSSFHHFKYEAGAPWGVWSPDREKELVVDLQDEKVTALNMGDAHWPRIGRVALMSLSQQLSVVDPESILQPTSGIWTLPFNGAPQNLAPDFGLPKGWVGEVVYPDSSATAHQLDRFALITRPKPYLKEPGDRQILIFMNSARPIRAFQTTTAGESPANGAWSPDGAYFAFTFGGELFVFEPTADGKELPAIAKPKSDSDF